MRFFYWLFFLLIVFIGFSLRDRNLFPQLKNHSDNNSLDCTAPIKSGLLVNKIKGISFVAPPKPFKENPVIPVKELGADFIAVLPYSYFNKNKPDILSFSSGGWWGERPEGVCQTIRLADEKGIKVMLKPQLWTHNQWIGDLDFESDEEWTAFHSSYTEFILSWAEIADSMKVDIFCIGTEIRHSTQKDPQFWKKLISKIRAIYKGKLTYAANWDDYDKVTFWNHLDFIGTDAYFPLSPDKTPSVCNLKKAWKPVVNKLKAFSSEWNKPVLFTEYGYLSLDACAFKTWELEKKRESAAVNQKAQANAVQALLETFSEQKWWAGGFLWKWYPDIQSSSGEGNRKRDYTPQGKMAQNVLKVMFH
jgi:hypothetical protein